MAGKTVKKPIGKPDATVEEPPQRPPRVQVITFRITGAEADLIRKAADRIPLARYSRDAVLARAGVDTKKN